MTNFDLIPWIFDVTGIFDFDEIVVIGQTVVSSYLLRDI